MTLCLLFSDHKSELDMICICMNLWGVAVLELDKINGSAILKKKLVHTCTEIRFSYLRPRKSEKELIQKLYIDPEMVSGYFFSNFMS